MSLNTLRWPGSLRGSGGEGGDALLDGRSLAVTAGGVSPDQYGGPVVRSKTPGFPAPPAARQTRPEPPDNARQEVQPHGVLQQICAVSE